jgi:hypothetical protein
MRQEMKLNGSFCSAFHRAVTFFAAPHVAVEAAVAALKPDAFCAVSFDPAVIALTFPNGAPANGGALPEGEFSVSSLGEDPNGGTPVKLHCRLLEVREIGDHRMVFAAVERAEIPGGTPSVYWRRASFRLQLDYPFLESSPALEGFIHEWHAGGLPKAAWTHAAHVAVTGYYALDNTQDDVFAIMKRGILHFNTCTGVVNGPDSGYHETLTRFWANMITHSIRDMQPGSRFEAAMGAVRLFGEDRDLPALFYSGNIVRNQHARREWVPPDQEPLPEWYAR